jgi:hypothetical protein
VRERPWTAADVPDQGGRTAVVTGANSGIGFETARALAEHGATVILACRDVTRGEAAAARISGPGPVAVQHLDLGSLASVRAAASEIHERHQRLDLLINNAGLMMPPYGTTSDGFEQQFGTNHLGHFALTGLLLDLLLPAAGSRTSALAAHPGTAITALTRYFPSAVDRAYHAMGQPIAQQPQAGALPTLRAATDPAARGGAYYGPDGWLEFKGYPHRVSSSARSHDEQAQRRLWQESERLTGVRYPDI